MNMFKTITDLIYHAMERNLGNTVGAREKKVILWDTSPASSLSAENKAIIRCPQSSFLDLLTNLEIIMAVWISFQ